MELWNKVKRFFIETQRSQEIDDLCLPPGVASLLTCGTKKYKGMGIRTVQQLLQYSKEDLLNVPGIKATRYWHIQFCLYYKGFIPLPRLPIMDVRVDWHEATKVRSWFSHHPRWASDLRKQDSTLMGRMAAAERVYGMDTPEAMKHFRKNEQYYAISGVQTMPKSSRMVKGSKGNNWYEFGDHAWYDFKRDLLMDAALHPAKFLVADHVYWSGNVSLDENGTWVYGKAPYGRDN